MNQVKSFKLESLDKNMAFHGLNNGTSEFHKIFNILIKVIHEHNQEFLAVACVTVKGYPQTRSVETGFKCLKDWMENKGWNHSGEKVSVNKVINGRFYASIKTGRT